AYEGFAIPLWEYFADELSAQLLPDYDGMPKGDEPTREVRADYSKVRALQEDEDALHQRLDNSFQAGWMKRSEVRAKAGLPVDKTEDDFYYFDLMTKMATPNDGSDSNVNGNQDNQNNTTDGNKRPSNNKIILVEPKMRRPLNSLLTHLPDEYSQKAEGDYEY